MRVCMLLSLLKRPVGESVLLYDSACVIIDLALFFFFPEGVYTFCAFLKSLSLGLFSFFVYLFCRL